MRRPICPTPARSSRRRFKLYKSTAPLWKHSSLGLLLSGFTCPSIGGRAAHGLAYSAGKVVYTQGGHGYTFYGGIWQTQRPLINNMVEDMGNEDQDTYFANYLLQAGATVVPVRPVGHQTNQVIVDNSDPGFSIISGSWTGDPVSSSNPIESTYWSDNNGNDTNRAMYATTSTTETAVAQFTPNIPVAGYYPVYAWAGYDAKTADLNAHTSNRAPDQTYRINYSGGSYEVRVDLQMTGFGWIYLGNYYFQAGTGGNVQVSNKSAVAGKFAIADAVRFGNGMGTYVPAGAVSPSGEPAEDGGGGKLYWIDYDSRAAGRARACAFQLRPSMPATQPTTTTPRTSAPRIAGPPT